MIRNTPLSTGPLPVAIFQIVERDAVARTAFPIQGGLALPRGAVAESPGLCVLDATGQPMACAVEPLTRWPDGSLRWVLLDFQTDLAAQETRRFSLAAECAPVLPPVVPGGVTDGEPLPRLARSGAEILGSLVEVVDANGREWTRREAGSTSVERRNGLRASVLTRGAVLDETGTLRLRWEARTDFVRGHAWVRTRFTYLAEGRVGERLQFRRLALRANVRLAGEPVFCLAGTTYPYGWHPMTPVVTPKPGRIAQIDANDSRIVADNGEVLRDQTYKSRGFVGAGGATGGLGLGLDECWQSFPKALAARRDALVVEFWPSEAAEPLALASGMARTHALTLAPYERPEDLHALVGGFATPILPQMTVEDWNRAGILPAQLAPRQTPVPLIETLSDRLFAGYTIFSNPASVGVWGLGEMNWGDFATPGYEARQIPGIYGRGKIWGNLEAQVPFGFLVQFLRAGRVDFLQQGLASARHEADVDTCHDTGQPAFLGAQQEHAADHAQGIFDWSHLWTSGMAMAYLLTGDLRLRTVLDETGEYLLRTCTGSPPEAFVGRIGGWLLIALCACHEALDAPRYLDAGRHTATMIRRWIDAGALLLFPPERRLLDPAHLGIALQGVVDLWRLTGDATARETLVAGGSLLVEQGCDASTGFLFAFNGQQASRWAINHALPVLAALHEATGERRWIEVGVHQLRVLFELMKADSQWRPESNWAQGGIFYAYAFSFLDAARRLGLLRDIG